jgi:hypothetical protein
MKKLMALFGLILILAGLTGCGKNPCGADTSTSTSTVTHTTTYKVIGGSITMKYDDENLRMSEPAVVNDGWTYSFTWTERNKNDRKSMYIFIDGTPTNNTKTIIAQILIDGYVVNQVSITGNACGFVVATE